MVGYYKISMKTQEITKRQKEVLKIIYEAIKSSGFPPSFSELKERLNISSNQSILDLLSALEKKRFIKREEGSARGMKILDKGFKVLGTKKLIPFLGTSYGGSLTETFEIEDEVKEIKNHSEVSKIDNVFFVKVSGDSMSDIINDGDVVLVKKNREFSSGDIVLARSPDGTTIKRLVSCDEPPYLYLRPENPNHKKIIVFTDDVEIIGKIIGIVKPEGIKQVE